MTNSASRREFLRRAAAFSVFGAGAPLAMQLAAAGSASAADATGYKAIVCLFLMGGQDSNNLVLATDSGSFRRYTNARNDGDDAIALMAPNTPPNLSAGLADPSRWGGVLPIVPDNAQANPSPEGGARPFAVHPFMDKVLPIWNAGRLAVLANVGMLHRPTLRADLGNPNFDLPPALGSHNDQQSAWLSGGIEGSKLGWGGQMADLYKSSNGASSVFTSISAAGNTVFLAGRDVNQYQISGTFNAPGVLIENSASGQLFSSTRARELYREILTTAVAPTTSNFGKDYAKITQRSVAAAQQINTEVSTKAGATIIPAPNPSYLNPIDNSTINPWADQLRAVAQIIKVAPGLGLKRQVFFLCVDAHDTHSDQNPREGTNVSRLAHAMAYFDSLLTSMNMQNQVTTFTAGDFSRGFTTNGNGTDHAWGGHHLIMGGAVDGRKMYGVYPELGIDGTDPVVPGFRNPDFDGNRMIPTTSVDQYAAKLGTWLGLNTTELNMIFPNLSRFTDVNLGFMKP